MDNPAGVVVMSSVGVVGSFDWHWQALQTKERMHHAVWELA